MGDTARILARYLHGVVIRSGSDEIVAALAGADHLPVMNALTPLHHPCQALADLMTLRERFGELAGLRLAYVGDGNNVARSLWVLGAVAGVEVRVASPRAMRSSRASPHSTPTTRRRPPPTPTPSTRTSGSAWATRRRPTRVARRSRPTR